MRNSEFTYPTVVGLVVDRLLCTFKSTLKIFINSKAKDRPDRFVVRTFYSEHKFIIKLYVGNSKSCNLVHHFTIFTPENVENEILINGLNKFAEDIALVMNKYI